MRAFVVTILKASDGPDDSEPMRNITFIRCTEHVDSQSLQNSQWDFKCFSTSYAIYLVKRTNLKRGNSSVWKVPHLDQF